MAGKGIFAWVCPCVDSFKFVEDSFISQKGWDKDKGGIVLMSVEEAVALSKEIEWEREVCGGSSMNVARAIGYLGYQITVTGQRGNDTKGEIVEREVAASGATSNLMVREGSLTTCVLIFVTPDAARTMIGVEGASYDPYVKKLEPSVIDDYDLVLTDGFLLAYGSAVELISQSIIRGKQMGKKTALVLASVFEIPAYKNAVLNVIDHVTILSGTLEEHMALFGKSTKEEVIAHLEKANFELCAVTMGAEGSYIFLNGKSYYFEAPDVAKVIDTTGAGDSFAAGLIYSYLSGHPIETVGKVASAVAGYTIARVGIDLKADLKDHVKPVLPQ